MSREIFTYLVRFVLLIAAQILLLNNVEFSGLINPYIYVYFILVLPVDFPSNVGLIIGFLLGLIIDLSSQTLGMHTIATVFMAYGRPYILRYMSPRDGYEFSRKVSVRQMGWLWFLTFSSIMIFLHHFVLFFIESFRMTGFGFLFMKAFSSSVLTLVIVIIIQLLFSKMPKSGL